MKKFIGLSALFLLASTGIFAATPAKPAGHKASSVDKMVTFNSLPSNRGIEVKLDNDLQGKASVIFYNYENDQVWKDVLSKRKGLDKGYILSFLDNGNYTVEVTIDKQVVRKIAHVYYKGDTKFVSLRG